MPFEFDVYGTALEPHPDDRNNLGTLADPPTNPSISLPAVGMTLNAIQ